MQVNIKSLILVGSFLLSAAAYADEGRIYISGPTTISAPGSYIVVNDIVATFTGIYIDSSNVKLDLNGFTVSHTGANIGDGVAILPGYNNVEVTNGAITGFTRHGVFVPGKSATGRNIKLNRLRISDNAISGISLESNQGFIVDDCMITNGKIGIYANGAGLVLNSLVSDAGSGLVSYSGGRTGYRSNVFSNNAPDVSGTPTNLGENLCSGAICP